MLVRNFLNITSINNLLRGRLVIFIFLIMNLISLINIKLIEANNSSYTTLSSIITDKRKMAVHSNNLANQESNGFIGDNLSTTNYIINNTHKNNDIQNQNFVITESNYLNSNEHKLFKTSDHHDITVIVNRSLRNNAGKRFVPLFKVQTNSGVAYKLNLSLRVNNQGFLVDMNGDFILSDNDAVIDVGIENQNFQVDEAGIIYMGSKLIDRVGIFLISYSDLEKSIEGLLKNKTSENIQLNPEHYKIKIGYLKKSNINNVQEIANYNDAYINSKSSFDTLKILNNLDNQTINIIK